MPKLPSITKLHVEALIAPDLECAVDDADLGQRLARNGYGYRDIGKRRVLVTLPHGVELMDLPTFH